MSTSDPANPVSRNLEPGQYQIGDFVFGEGTLFNVESIDGIGYDVNVQDFQVPQSNEMRYGQDTLKPMPIQLNINARHNFILPNIVALTSDTRDYNFDYDAKVGTFSNEWRADEARAQWGTLKPLLVCRQDGRVVRIYGRPGKLAIPQLTHKGQNQKIVAEFRRSDTLCYADFEWFVHTRALENVTMIRAQALDMGDVACWVKMFLVGPMTHPIVQLGLLTVELDYTLAPGEIVEISSYPWERRCVSLTTGASLSPKLISPYLDKLLFPADALIDFSWNATDLNVAHHALDFAEYGNGDLPSTNWYVDASGPGAGTMDITSGKLVFHDSGNQSRLITAIYKTPTLTNYQLVGMTLNSPGELSISGEECTNRIIGRANATRTEYYYWDISFTQYWYGYHKNGVDYILSQPVKLSWIQSILRFLMDSVESFLSLFDDTKPWKYEAEFGNGNGVHSSTLRLNDHIVASVALPGEPVAVDENHRLTGVGMHATTRVAGQSTPGPVDEFHMRDNATPDIMTELDVSAVFLMWRDAWGVV